ncbi:porphobilinogen deaminase [bacterium BMS3Bbin08]|nr:porphobilinogen deaminase [bacterium BMS3Bbin08]
MSRKSKKIIIATRGSKLALWQANWIKSRLKKELNVPDIALNIIKTTGDKILDVPLAKVGGKGLFVKEIEEALLRGDADLAVHSMKDVPTDLPRELHIAAICEREDPRDALITTIHDSRFTVHGFKNLPEGAKIGTSSLRRSCQLLNIRPDLKIEQLRGNLDTRIRKLDEGQYDAIIVAAAGVKRLGMADRITETFGPDITLPAIAQGAIGIECRKDDEHINELLGPLNHTQTSVCVRAERAFLKKLEGGCQVPIAAYAQLVATKDEGRRMKDEPDSSLVTRHSLLVIDGLVGNIAGDVLIRGSIEGTPDNAESLGIALAEDLLSKGAGKILAEVYKQQ